MFKKIVLLFLAFSLSLVAEEIVSSGRIYIDNTEKYKFKMFVNNLNDTMLVKRVYFNMNDDTLLIENIKIGKKNLIPYFFESKEFRFGRFEKIKKIADTKFVMKFRKTNTSEMKIDTIEDDDENVIFSFLVPKLINANYSKLLNGEMVNFRLLVPSRMETVGFRVRFLKKEKGLSIIKMEASSWIIRKLVNPLYFYFDDNLKLVKYKGRISIPDEHNKSQDGTTIYY